VFLYKIGINHRNTSGGDKMIHTILGIDQKIKLEIGETAPYLFFWGKISGIQNKYFFIDIEGYYILSSTKAVKCTIPYEGKVCLFETSIEGALGNRLTLMVPSEENMEILQRRKYVRVPVEYEVICFLKEYNNQKLNESKMFFGIVKNISGGGVLLNSILSLPVNAVLVFELKLEGTLFPLTVKVLRNDKNRDEKTYDLGCEFIGIDEGDRQRITSFCSRKQIAIKKGGK
jgi:c-di-GMP-binding flagellar brake protein YcgR